MGWRPPPGAEPAYARTPRMPLVSSGPDLDAKVKWYDSGKGFGFVELGDGSGDAFLHASVVERFGQGVPGPGAAARVRVGRGPKGPQVTELLELGPADPNAAPAPRRQAPAYSPGPTLGEGQEMMGTVKWYNAQKGFGFITPENGGKDVFVHASALGRSGITDLNPGQVVRLQVVAGKKGPEASSVELT
jgi:cold shock protein